MNSKIDHVLTVFAKETGNIPNDKLLEDLCQALYQEMGYSGKGSSKPTVQGARNLAIYLSYQYKNNQNKALKSVLRAALQAVLGISNQEVLKEVQTLKDIVKDAYFPSNEISFVTKLDEMIAIKSSELYGGIGVVKIAILESEVKLEKKVKSFAFLEDNRAALYYRKLLMEIKVLGKFIDNIIHLNTLEEKDVEKETMYTQNLSAKLKKILSNAEEVPELMPLRNAETILKNMEIMKYHHNESIRLQALSKISTHDIPLESCPSVQKILRAT